jgi:hypothetical protein
MRGENDRHSIERDVDKYFVRKIVIIIEMATVRIVFKQLTNAS